ncbi:Uncharacterised protein [Mycobacteroides abscessus subsp. abscessus]|nr:Uncharacterised protein [Mycobacteroides abscessus subsp. abscessus]
MQHDAQPGPRSPATHTRDDRTISVEQGGDEVVEGVGESADEGGAVLGRGEIAHVAARAEVSARAEQQDRADFAFAACDLTQGGCCRFQ